MARFRRGFTLIELLSVLGILVTLSGILFPVFAMLRVRAQQTACASNLRQLDLAIRLYASDHDEGWPLNAHSSIPTTWGRTVRAYAGGRWNEIRLCPADAQRAARLAQGGTSYVFNESLTRDAGAGTIALFEQSIENGVREEDDHIHNRDWFAREPKTIWKKQILNDIQPDQHRLGVGRGRNRRPEGSANYLYADGHLKAISAAQIKAWADSGFDFTHDTK
jgi:prepilin-type N-terminal cleavage/methylation domain-containing protein/prepilin-type processing-associated H-X9-DG protein